ncbi:MAG: hypothetical protein ACK58L_14365, partial [Planctomycetota bacterium]
MANLFTDAVTLFTLWLFASQITACSVVMAQDDPLGNQQDVVPNDGLIGPESRRVESKQPAAKPKASSASAVAPTAPKDPLLFESGPTRVKFSLDAVFQQSGVTGSWWNLSEQFAPDAGYKLDRAWAESWVKPGVRLDTKATEWLTLYSGVSYVGSGNIGEDVFEQGYRGLWGVEDAYLGARFQLPDED